MNTTTITETMEQVHKHVEKYIAVHKETVDDHEALVHAIRERWGEVDHLAILEQAELNSIAASRRKLLSDRRTNPWIETHAQGDLFDAVGVKIPSMLLIDGKPRPYYQVSILEGLEWWRARQDNKATEASAFRTAADARDQEASEATSEAEKLEKLISRAMDHGVDPRSVLYAKQTT